MTRIIKSTILLILILGVIGMLAFLYLGKGKPPPKEVNQTEPAKAPVVVKYEQDHEVTEYGNSNFVPVSFRAPPKKEKVKAEESPKAEFRMAIGISRNRASAIKSHEEQAKTDRENAVKAVLQKMTAIRPSSFTKTESGGTAVSSPSGESVAERKWGGKKRNPDIVPMGRFLRCELVNTLETTSVGVRIPIIGVVAEDFRYNGTVLIPRGTEIHGYQGANFRERITAADMWNLVFSPDKRHPEGARLPVRGVVFHRDEVIIDYETGEVKRGEKDLSTGFSGFVIKDLNRERILMVLSAALQAAATGLQDRTQSGAYQGSVIEASGRNALLAGAAGALGVSMEELERQIKENGYYTIVPAGTQFFLYLEDDLDFSNAGLFFESDEEEGGSPDSYLSMNSLKGLIPSSGVSSGDQPVPQVNPEALASKTTRIVELVQKGVIPQNALNRLVEMQSPVQMDAYATQLLEHYE